MDLFRSRNGSLGEELRDMRYGGMRCDMVDKCVGRGICCWRSEMGWQGKGERGRYAHTTAAPCIYLVY
jgi:hypothetical protein